MKKLVALLLLTLGTSAFAIDETDTWETIRANNKIQLSNTWAFVGYSTSVFEVCVDGDNLTTLEPKPIYEYRRVSRDRDERVIVGYKHYTHPITYTSYREICTGRNDNNCRKVPYQTTQKVTRDITVSKFVRTVGGRDNGRDIYKELFKKEFVIPVCNF